MSKSEHHHPQTPGLPPSQDLKIVEIDEGVFGRLSERIPKPARSFSPPGNMNFLKVLDDDDIQGLFEQDWLDDDESPAGRHQNFDIEGFEERLQNILKIDNLEVNESTLLTYLEYLKKHLQIPCHLTGIEDFEWEEPYVFGLRSSQEYERLKKTRPSYTDTFKLLQFVEKIENEEDGIYVEVQRVSDRKKFTLRLYELESSDQKSPNYQLLDDYAVWFVNYH
jgi:hypothetical protein